ncbi:glutamate synthase-related protein [Amycolatopsis sp. NPDC005961]|uniref:glutamate synthase-related protein n=1 Tax=Amycolatopsis sp. NPDC005961 TaxID=3156720 RepID=UPI0033CF048B
MDEARLVPPVFVPRRLEKLIELGREPLYGDVSLSTSIGGFESSLPLYLSAFGSTQVAGAGLGAAASAQAARLGIPMVIGENVVPMHGHGRAGGASDGTLLERMRAYADAVPDGLGGVVVQQSTEDADAEVWNLVYSDPSAAPLLESGRLAFELKVGQGAKPGLGGMTLVSPSVAASLSDLYTVDASLGAQVLRSSSPGTFTDEILRQQIRLMRNNFPRAGVWVKLPPGRDVASAASVAWAAGASAVTVDGAEGGSGWAPTSFASVGLPLAECLARIGTPAGCLLASGRMWEGTRVAKVLALGARAAGLGRAALLAVDTDPVSGLVRFAEALALELRLLLSALGQYRADALTRDDVWFPGTPEQVREQVLS